MNNDDALRIMMALRAQLVHALAQRNIGAKRFNAIREQLIPLDAELRKLGADLSPTPQMNPAYVRPTKIERAHARHRNVFTKRMMARVGKKGGKDANND